MLKVVSNLAEIVKMRRTSVPYTISKYVERPFLISSCHGRVKFDFRYHIIVRSFCPLEAYAMKRFWPKLASKSYDLEVKFDNLCPWVTYLRKLTTWAGTWQISPYLKNGINQTIGTFRSRFVILRFYYRVLELKCPATPVSVIVNESIRYAYHMRLYTSSYT